MYRYPLLFLFILLFSCQGGKDKEPVHYTAQWESLCTHPTPDWFQDGKLGIYFHWGVYSVPAFGTEWYPRHMYLEGHKGWGSDVRPYHLETYGPETQYHDFIPQFTAVQFDAEEWAELFEKAGARWAGPVAEHCDNFSMWESRVNPWNAARMGPKRDIVGELEKAIRKEGLKFTTTFHHQWNWAWYPVWSGLVDTSTAELRDFYGEWTSPETFSNYGEDPEHFGPSDAFVEEWKAKVYEVVDLYHPDMLWFDSRLNVIPEEERLALLAKFYNSGETEGRSVVFHYKNQDIPKGAGVVDIERGRMNGMVEYPWLTDDSWDWSGWGYKNKHEYKDANHVLDGFIDIVSKNGCLLLNIGPRPDGTIPEEVKEGLLKMGGWLDRFGEAIYGTRPYVTFGEGPTQLLSGPHGGVSDHGKTYTSEDFRFTTKGNYLYIIQMAPPDPSGIHVLETFAREGKGAGEEIKSIRLLGGKERISWHMDEHGLHLKSPWNPPDDMALVYKVKLNKTKE